MLFCTNLFTYKGHVIRLVMAIKNISFIPENMNTILKITHRALSSIFFRGGIVIKDIKVKKMHSICNRATSKIGSNEEQINPHFLSLLGSTLPLFNQICGMKYKTVLRLRCKGCYYVSRKEIMYVMCKLKPRHKQSIIPKKEKSTWIWTHASQSKRREW